MWNNKFKNRYFDWAKICKNTEHDEKELTLKTFNWKIVSNIHAIHFLHRVGKAENNICETCNKAEYIFFECTKNQNIWSELSHLIFTKYDVNYNIKQSDGLFGYNADKNNKGINKLTNVAKLTISKYKCGKYPNIIP